MAAVLQTTFSKFNTFSWTQMYEFRVILHRSLIIRVKLTKFQYWFKYWLGADQATSHCLNQWCLNYWRIYASLGLNELTHQSMHCWRLARGIHRWQCETSKLWSVFSTWCHYTSVPSQASGKLNTGNGYVFIFLVLSADYILAHQSTYCFDVWYKSIKSCIQWAKKIVWTDIFSCCTYCPSQLRMPRGVFIWGRRLLPSV